MRHAVTFAVVVLALPVAAARAQNQDPAPPVAGAPAAKPDALRFALVEPDGHRRPKITDAVRLVTDGGAEGLKSFVALRRRIAKNAPAPESKPAAASQPAAGAPAPAEAKPVDFPQPIKDLMNTATTGAEDASTAALDGLAKAGDDGTAALRRLDERSLAILSRMVSRFMTAQIGTNTLYAGQYEELKNYGPDAANLLARWTIEPPREAEGSVESFKGACVRALRDVIPADRANDALRGLLREVAQRAAKAGNEDLLYHAASALRQFGDAEIFDAVKKNATDLAKGDDAMKKFAGWKALSELYYNARDYGEACAAYKEQVAAAEAAKVPTNNMATVFYNACCTHSLAGKLDEAAAYLDKALTIGAKSGATPKAMLEADRDITALRADPRYAELVQKHFGGAAPPR